MTEYQNPTIEKAHNAINCVFREILPKYGRAVREGQIDLCHHIFDSLYSRSICLGNAAVGVGKTDAYLIAAVILNDTGGKYINFKLEFPKRKEGVNGRK